MQPSFRMQPPGTQSLLARENRNVMAVGVKLWVNVGARPGTLPCASEWCAADAGIIGAGGRPGVQGSLADSFQETG